MLENIYGVQNLAGLSRKKKSHYEVKAIHPSDLQKFEAEGWIFVKKLKFSVQIKKEKAHNVLLEDRVWNLFYKMNFKFLSGLGGAKLVINPKDSKSPKSQLDVVALDSEVAIAVECKSSGEYKKRLQFQEELGKFNQLKESFNKAVKVYSEIGIKLQTVFILVTNRALLTDMDKARAKLDITHHSLPLISVDSLPLISVQSLPVWYFLD